MSQLIYNAQNVWLDLAEAVMLDGNNLESRAGLCKELVNMRIVMPEKVLSLPIRGSKCKSSLRYACTELLWYLAREDKVDRLLRVAPGYSRFANNGIAMGAYGSRWRKCPGGDQLANVYRLLSEKPETRQAIVTMWHSFDLPETIRGIWKDIPCTIAMQFLLRNNELGLIVTMRSNDLFLGFPYDSFCFRAIQILMAAALDVEVGEYAHNVGSFHAYESNFEKIEAARDEDSSECERIDIRPSQHIAKDIICGRYSDDADYSDCPFITTIEMGAK